MANAVADHPAVLGAKPVFRLLRVSQPYGHGAIEAGTFPLRPIPLPGRVLRFSWPQVRDLLGMSDHELSRHLAVIADAEGPADG